MSDFNIKNYLNSLPEDVEKIDVSYKKLTYLPDLSRFKNLQILNCHFNNLTSLPQLNKNLKILFCSNNKLTSLPQLNNKLKILHCSYNELTLLPQLNEELIELYCSNNFIPQILINDGFILETKRNLINNVAKCRYRIMCLKYKEHFRRWLWIKVRLPRIENHYHPDNLKELLDKLGDDCEEDVLDEAIENW